MRREAIRETLYQLELKRRRLLQPYFAELGLASGQPRILNCLFTHPDGLTQRELAERCGLDTTSLSRALDKLEEVGLVSRAPHEESRRANLIGLTTAGEEKARAVASRFSNMDEVLCWGLSDGELEGLLKGLERLEENLDGVKELHIQ